MNRFLLALGCVLLIAASVFAQQPGQLDEEVMAVLGRPSDAPPAPAAISPRAQDIDSKLRCPVCQGVSIADSPSGMATKMRGQVRDLVAAGYTDEQVLSYFERSYGEFVRLDPPLRGLNWVLWVMPGLLLLAGGMFVVFRARQPAVKTANTAAATTTSANAANDANADPAMAKYLEQIRRDSGLSS